MTNCDSLISRITVTHAKGNIPFVSDVLSNYEKVLADIRSFADESVDATRQFGTSDWIRLRQGLPRHYEDLAMRISPAHAHPRPHRVPGT